MASRYALELERIYGVPGSEYVGYLSTDLALVNQTSPVCHLNREAPPTEVSSTGSSAQEKTVVDMGGEVTTPSISGTRPTAAVVVDKGKPTMTIKHRTFHIDIIFLITSLYWLNKLQGNRPTMV